MLLTSRVHKLGRIADDANPIQDNVSAVLDAHNGNAIGSPEGADYRYLCAAVGILTPTACFKLALIKFRNQVNDASEQG